VHAHKPEFGHLFLLYLFIYLFIYLFFLFFFILFYLGGGGLPFANFFLAPFFSFFSALLLSLLFTFHIRSGCRKKLGFIYGQSLEMGP